MEWLVEAWLGAVEEHLVAAWWCTVVAWFGALLWPWLDGECEARSEAWLWV